MSDDTVAPLGIDSARRVRRVAIRALDERSRQRTADAGIRAAAAPKFRAEVIAIGRKGEAPLRQIAKDFGVSDACLHSWLKSADREGGVDSGRSWAGGDQSAELREARKRIKLL